MILYDSSMDPRTLAAELDREPFIPLRLHLSDERTVDVQSPDMAIISRLSLYLFRTDRLHRHLAEDHHVISLRHIVSVELLEPASA
jgi:hypothetical protein